MKNIDQRAPATAAPRDLMDLLVENHRENRPLLEGATVYRGSRLPDQSLGSFSAESVHATLLPQVATNYTHNHSSQDAAFIGAYKLDRSAKFFADFGIERGERGASVPDVEKSLAPAVARLSGASTSFSRESAAKDIENIISKSFYEVAIPARSRENPAEPNRPDQLYSYAGPPHARDRRIALHDMTPLNERNTELAKEAVYRQQRSPVVEDLRSLMHSPAEPASPVANQAVASVRTALGRLEQLAQGEFGREVKEAHGAKPLHEFLAGVRDHPVSKKEAQLGMLGSVMVEAANSEHPAMRAQGLAAARQIAALPEGATYKDMLQAMKQAREAPASRSTDQFAQPHRQAPESSGREHVASARSR